MYKTGIPIKSFEWDITRKDGARRTLEFYASLLRDSNDRLTGFRGIVRDNTERKQLEKDRQHSFERLRKSLGATVQAMASVVETKDPYTSGHQRRVADLARAVATEMNLPSDQIDGLRMASTIHDIGKISVPAEILSMPRKLTDIEFSLIKMHAQSGYDILKDIEFPWPIARMILEHHERMDGSGYPNGLTGGNLLIESRILTVADVVDSMASYRPYRPALGLDAALEEITKNRGVLYDSEVVDACRRLFNEKGYKLAD
jgi:HD-GYP domain-containing protein (c-di-GMP phosphodiesterase class II)